MLNFISSIKSILKPLVAKLTFSPIKYWENRAKTYGELSVLNLNYSKDELEKVKDFQIKTIFPLLKNLLTGEEKTLLDFGCGPGRFTIELAEAIHGKVLGADPIEYLLQLAPKNNNVSYKKITGSTIPVKEERFDVIWICLVLGGILSKKNLNRTLKEVNRVSKDGALLFLIENTTDKKDIISWRYRSKKHYRDMFKNFNLEHLQDYTELGECISIFAGRKTITN